MKKYINSFISANPITNTIKSTGGIKKTTSFHFISHFIIQLNKKSCYTLISGKLGAVL